MTTHLNGNLETALRGILSSMGLDPATARLSPCPKPDMGDCACSAPLAGARILRTPPMELAEAIAKAAAGIPGVAEAKACAPGFVNFRFSDDALWESLRDQADGGDFRLPPEDRRRVLLDFGGPNIKPMHVGHLRSLTLGESLRRILSELGHDVASDIHFGDWGLPLGMILSEILLRRPDLAALPPEAIADAEFDPAELASLYPEAAKACKEDLVRMEAARAATTALQSGDPFLSALWRAVVDPAKAAILRTCSELGACFDLLLGESDAQPSIPALLRTIEDAGFAAREGDGALVAAVAMDGDRRPMPPLVLEKPDGGALYATTDLATLQDRMALEPAFDEILYVVDGRQELHFEQVFRLARKAGISKGAALEHVGFGTVDGPDGRPLRTRDGGTLPLSDLISAAVAAAKERSVEGGREAAVAAASKIGIAALKIADLSSDRRSGYVLDMERALSFEGRTGPYLLYAVVRLRSILAKAGEEGAAAPPAPASLHPAERALARQCLSFPGALAKAGAERAPHHLAAWAFDAASAVGRLVAELPVAKEPDPRARAARLSLSKDAVLLLEKALFLLGCEVPEAM